MINLFSLSLLVRVHFSLQYSRKASDKIICEKKIKNCNAFFRFLGEKSYLLLKNQFVMLKGTVSQDFWPYLYLLKNLFIPWPNMNNEHTKTVFLNFSKSQIYLQKLGISVVNDYMGTRTNVFLQKSLHMWNFLLHCFRVFMFRNVLI